MDGDAGKPIRLGAALAVVGGAIAVVAVYLPAFKVSGQGVNATEKLFRDWEGKVALITAAIMIAGGVLIWFLPPRQSASRVAGLVWLAALVCVATAAYAITVFHGKTLDTLASQFGKLRGIPASQVRPLLVAAVNSGALKLSGKIGVPVLIAGAGLAFFGAILVFAKGRRPSEVGGPLPASP